MVLLQSVTVSGFKSFREEQTICFKPGFCCVTGANGSGKSNILDAISFALGDKIPNLRVTSQKDLLCRGESSCSVVLRFGLKDRRPTITIRGSLAEGVFL